MLGVRRATVTEAMTKLQACGVKYSNGRVTIVDRTALEAASCECYALIVHEFNRLLGDRHDGPQSPLRNLKASEHGISTTGTDRQNEKLPEDP